MTLVSKQLTEYIERPADEVYEYASNPAHLPEWAPGLGSAAPTSPGSSRWSRRAADTTAGLDTKPGPALQRQSEP